MGIKFSNRAISKLAASITDAATSIAITSGDEGKFPALGAGDWHYATIFDDAGNREIVKVTARSGITMTVERAQEGTTALAFDAGAGVELRFTAGAAAEIVAAIDGKADTGHSHTIANVTGLQTALDGKAEASHSHAISGVTGLQTALDGKVSLDSRQRGNVLINGGFDVWQRGTSQTSGGYGSDDRWLNQNIGSTKTHSRQAFALGQTDVPGNPKYFSRTVVSSVAGANNICLKQQRIEGVSTLAGETATLSFYAKADAAKNIAIELIQYFGTGGAPSASVATIGSQLIALTTAWQRFSVTVNIPSIAGKTLGTDGNDTLQVNFWFDAGSNLSARAANLGQQSGTFDIANVQLEKGSVATEFEKKTYAEELLACQRYYSTGSVSIRGNATGGSQVFEYGLQWFVTMRGTPAMTLNSSGQSNCTVLLQSQTSVGARVTATSSASGGFFLLAAQYTADAEL